VTLLDTKKENNNRGWRESDSFDVGDAVPGLYVNKKNKQKGGEGTRELINLSIRNKKVDTIG